MEVGKGKLLNTLNKISMIKIYKFSNNGLLAKDKSSI